ncbi:MAG: PDR/VanB family oxidoreductase [Lacisediminihabitans sp.]
MSSAHDTEFDLVVVARSHAAEGVEFFELASPAGEAVLPWEPGAHIDVILHSGEERQYSLCGRPDAATWRIAVLRETAGRGGSAWLHNELAAGDTLRVRGPRNHFAFSPQTGASYLFIAGGIGITPIAPMLDAAAAADVDYALHYAGRSRVTMALADELEDAHAGRVSIHAADEGNRLDLGTLFAGLDPATIIYCCGPARLMDAVQRAVQRAAPARLLHVERFEAKELGEPVLHESFEVELALTGTTLTVPPHRSILEVVEDSGVLVLSSCQEGTCGTCETPVLEGEVDHRDSILTPEEQAENRVMYICVSRAACSRLVLEL